MRRFRYKRGRPDPDTGAASDYVGVPDSGGVASPESAWFLWNTVWKGYISYGPLHLPSDQAIGSGDRIDTALEPGMAL